MRVRITLLGYAGIVVLLGYAIVWLALTVMAREASTDTALAAELAERRALLTTGHVLDNLPAPLATFLPVAALIVGGQFLRTEFRSGLLAFLAARGVARSSLALAKAIALFLVGLTTAAGTIAVGLASSWVVTGHVDGFPPVGPLAAFVLIFALTWTWWGAVGMIVTTVTRSSHAATALAVIWLVAGSVVAQLSTGNHVAARLLHWTPPELSARAWQATDGAASGLPALLVLAGHVAVAVWAAQRLLRHIELD
ncbi:ABC transporter permease [Nocardioides sp.]|uniref:ABC transporter permease n=1 Tax=Nocardioides sp. TaxID=35761 RepID=UPI002C28A0D4|nr:ABC transporter permease subunit [Nocardioides sp.]HSX68854.1 ABC transporter permease subunit [Nocardioides sp.]